MAIGSVSVRIRGRVQGVGFRYWFAREAEARALTGWVRNCRDGSVEAVLCGAGEALADMLTECRIGPRLADVTAVDVDHIEVADFQGMEIRPSA